MLINLTQDEKALLLAALDYFTDNGALEADEDEAFESLLAKLNP